MYYSNILFFVSKCVLLYVHEITQSYVIYLCKTLIYACRLHMCIPAKYTEASTERSYLLLFVIILYIIIVIVFVEYFFQVLYIVFLITRSSLFYDEHHVTTLEI